MPAAPRLTVQLARFATAAALAIGLLTTVAPPVFAECDGPVPSFREKATSADTVVIGDVTSVDLTSGWRDGLGGSSRFTLRVRYEVVGTAGPTMRVQNLRYLPCADHVLTARPGDTIALALGLRRAGAEGDFATAAWLRGSGAGEKITLSQVYALFGLRVPDTATAPVAVGQSGVASAFLATAGVLGVLAFAWRTRRRRTVE